ncbi:hypothetical protein [Clostridium sp. Marseille-Q7071]
MYNGINSELMGVAIAFTENGMIEMPLDIEEKIVEEKLDKRNSLFLWFFK